MVLKLPQLRTVQKLRSVGLISARMVAEIDDNELKKLKDIGDSGLIEIREAIPHCSPASYRQRKKREGEVLQGSMFAYSTGRRQAC